MKRSVEFSIRRGRKKKINAMPPGDLRRRQRHDCQKNIPGGRVHSLSRNPLRFLSLPFSKFSLSLSLLFFPPSLSVSFVVSLAGSCLLLLPSFCLLARVFPPTAPRVSPNIVVLILSSSSSSSPLPFVPPLSPFSRTRTCPPIIAVYARRCGCLQATE